MANTPSSCSQDEVKRTPLVHVFCDSNARKHVTHGKVADEFNRPYTRRYLILEALLAETHVTILPRDELEQVDSIVAVPNTQVARGISE